MKKCMEMVGMKDMDMKGMNAQKCQEMMKGMNKHPAKESKAITHKVDAVVKEVDAANGQVTLAH